MKRKVLLISSMLLTLIIGVIVLLIDKNENIYENREITQSNSGFLTLMLETEAGSGEYQVSTSNSWPGDGYVFNENMSTCENGSKLYWNEELGAVTLSTGISDRCFVYFDVVIPTLAEYIINNVYIEDGVNGLYYHDGVGTYTNADQEAGDNSYRYSGANPNNYVCFGSNEEICPTENLYRIIGVFGNQAKLIKETSYGSYFWNSERLSNLWSDSTLNQNILNNQFLNAIDEIWRNTISIHNWQVGGNTSQNIYDVAIKQSYQNELINPSENLTYSSKIGLIYASDYGYATSPDNWVNTLYNDGINNDNWLNSDLIYWTITPCFDSSRFVLVVVPNGVYWSDVYTNESNVFPTFYLNSDVLYDYGDGSQQNPIRLKID